jgi:hypothetical protein
VAEGGGLLNRYTGITRIVGSNPIPSAIIFASTRRGRRVDYRMQRANRTVLAVAVLLSLPLAACEQASSWKPGGWSDPALMHRINRAYEARDNCLSKHIVPNDANNSSAQAIAAAAALSCQSETNALIAVSNPYGDPRVTAAITRDSEFRALRFVLEARSQ